MSDFYAISVDRAQASELDRVHAVIKQHADGWWHRHANLWIAGGQTATEWRDLIKPHIQTPASVLVLKLPAEAARFWAFSGNDASTKCKWFHENYKD